MKVKFNKSFRIRIMLYTFCSLLAAVLCDVGIFLMCLHFRLLVRDYGKYAENMESRFLPEELAVGEGVSDTANVIMSRNDVFYRVFGVGIRGSLIFLLVLVALIVFVLVFFLLTRSLTGYIDDILSSAQKMADGDLDHRIKVLHHDEFSCIADSINRMADKVCLMQKNEQAAEQAKNELITNVAHDLRTPLTSIIGYMDIVNSDSSLSAEKRSEYLKIAWEKAKRLEKLINELFSLTRIGYGKMPMDKKKIDLIRLLEQEIEELYPTFEENHLKCIFEPDTESCMIEADGEHLIRVFDNLLGNAIRYGRYGKVVRIRTQRELSKIHVQVINYGTVIPEKSLPHLFEKFYKVDASRQSEQSGTGLGLAIAKSIVESHDGEIFAGSSFDGTIFEVILPTLEE